MIGKLTFATAFIAVILILSLDLAIMTSKVTQ